jgi:hypothetical protein
MKLKLLVLLVGIISLSTANAYEVSTEVQKKNALLEVFTGIHCGNCPDGDVYTDNLVAAQPEHVFAIDIHSGYYAVPNADEPDYRIDEGEAIDTTMGANKYGYPCAAINRRHFPQETLLVQGRSYWAKKSKTIHEEDAPVNLHVRATFDGNTRELQVTVEGYYTQQVEENENFLHVTLLQDNIVGYQSGATDRYNYNHRHMLRAYLTPLWGDTIPAPQQGDYFTRQYTYTTPQSIKAIPVEPKDMEIIVFVSADKKEVLNVSGRKPEYLNYTIPLAATLQAPKPEITARYGYNFFDALLKNESTQTISDAAFQVSVNGNEQTVNWSGEIAPFHSGMIRLPVEPYVFVKDNTYQIQLVALNEKPFAGNTLQGSFNAPVETTPQIEVEIKTDLYADENTFTIRNRTGEKVYELGPYAAGVVETYIDTIDLEPSETYCFEITDAWNDGMMSPRGLYKLFSDNHTMFAQNYEVKVFGAKVFFQTTLPPSITALSSVEQAKTEAFVNNQMLEIVFQSLSSGKAEITLCSIDGKHLLNRTVSSQAGICTATIPVAAVPHGIYLLIINQQEKREVIKFKI